ncbi:hypothetical protein GOP47_0001665 [Adiantum capillus-veneris]|uniref:Translocation protein SEC62 n=1 Tax=Adiantum capillus-veneris TaxID=13818 RepID=A0A9D4ZQC0_ADICA|nr:hypothetical protein GOP47_0001665 [Adiantum capillus-veneris]
MARKKVPEVAPAAQKQKQKKEIDPVQTFAEKIRDHKDLESRWAVLQDTRVEYFRGKDFTSFLQGHQDTKALLGSYQASTESEDDVGNLLLKRKLIVRCDRVVKTLRPGKTRLSKWPARLELHPDQSFSVDDAFFAWTFERRRPLWQTVLSILVPIVTVACCLFPVSPYWCKLVVIYTCFTFLAAIFTLLFLRLAIFGFMWIVLGKRVWFFPNILAEEASFKDLFQFWPEPSKEDEKPPKWTARLAVAAVLGLLVWFSIHYAPDEAARTRYHRKVSNIIDDVLEWSPKLALSGKQAKVSTGSNESQMNATTNETARQQAEPSNPIQSGEAVNKICRDF